MATEQAAPAGDDCAVRLNALRNSSSADFWQATIHKEWKVMLIQRLPKEKALENIVQIFPQVKKKESPWQVTWPLFLTSCMCRIWEWRLGKKKKMKGLEAAHCREASLCAVSLSPLSD